MRTLDRLPSLWVARRRLDSRASWASASVGATVSNFSEIGAVMVFSPVSRQEYSTTSSKRTQYSKHSKEAFLNLPGSIFPATAAAQRRLAGSLWGFSRSRDDGINPLDKSAFRKRTDLCGQGLALFEDYERRDAADAILHLRFGVDVDIHPGERELSSLRLDDLVDHRGDLPARPAPNGPKFNKDRPFGLEHFLLELALIADAQGSHRISPRQLLHLTGQKGEEAESHAFSWASSRKIGCIQAGANLTSLRSSRRLSAGSVRFKCSRRSGVMCSSPSSRRACIRRPLSRPAASMFRGVVRRSSIVVGPRSEEHTS